MASITKSGYSEAGSYNQYYMEVYVNNSNLHVYVKTSSGSGYSVCAGIWINKTRNDARYSATGRVANWNYSNRSSGTFPSPNGSTSGDYAITRGGTVAAFFGAGVGKYVGPWDSSNRDFTDGIYISFPYVTVTFNANGGSGGGSVGGYEGESLTASASPTRTGYTFDGWYTSASGGSKVCGGGGSFSCPSGNATYYAHWTVQSKTITIRKGTGISDITSPAWGWSGGGTYKTGSANYGSSFTVNASVSTGYHWVNWTGSFTTTTQNYTFTIGNQNYDITANAAANTYTVKYNANGGTGTTASSSHTYNSAKALTANGFSRTGYTFLGWSTSSSATTATYTDKQSVTNLTSTNGGTVNLYAIWSINSYYLDLNGWLDGTSSGGITPHGTANVIVNGTTVGTNVTDYYTQHPYGSSYSITNIQAKPGYQYNGVHSGSVSGTIGAANVAVALDFSTVKPSNLVLNGTVNGPFSISLSWSASGLNITNYKLYANGTKVYDGTGASYELSTTEETIYNLYFTATNVGGTTTSSTLILETPADQAKIRIRKNGEWLKGKTYFKKNGQWVKAKKIYVKKNGEWVIGTNYDPE